METQAVVGAPSTVEGSQAPSLPELVIRELQVGDADEVKQFCLNILMQRARLSNQYVFRSPVWLAMYLSSIAWATQRFEPWTTNDWGRWAFLCCAISALFLVGVDYFTYHHYEARTQGDLKADAFLQNPASCAKSKTDKCWVAYYNDGLVGTIVFKKPESKSTRAEIQHWYVRARYREKGLGGDLLETAIEHAKQTKCTTLLANTTSINKRANKSLQKVGFRKDKAEPDNNVYWRMLRMKCTTWSLDMQSSSKQTSTA